MEQQDNLKESYKDFEAILNKYIITSQLKDLIKICFVNLVDHVLNKGPEIAIVNEQQKCVLRCIKGHFYTNTSLVATFLSSHDVSSQPFIDALTPKICSQEFPPISKGSGDEPDQRTTHFEPLTPKYFD